MEAERLRGRTGGDTFRKWDEWDGANGMELI